MLKNLNEEEWVAVYDTENTFIKVARIEHKITLIGEEAKTYGKSYIELLFIRIKDKMSGVIEHNKISHEYLIVDTDAGKEHGSNYGVIVKKIPDYHNVVRDNEIGRTWGDEIERQKIIYTLSDVDWKTFGLKELKSVKHKLDELFFERNILR